MLASYVIITHSQISNLTGQFHGQARSKPFVNNNNNNDLLSENGKSEMENLFWKFFLPN